MFDQGIAKPTVIAQADSVGIDIDFAKGRFRQWQRGKEEVEALTDLSLEMDHESPPGETLMIGFSRNPAWHKKARPRVGGAVSDRGIRC